MTTPPPHAAQPVHPVPVKICGITRVEDALAAQAHGARAVGFIFYPPSPRAVTAAQAAAITAALHPWTLRVGVFVNASAAEINETAALAGLDRIQLHGDEPHSLLADLHRPGYRVFRLRDEQDLAALQAEPDRIVMLDTYDTGLYGGTGRTGDWSWARSLGESRTVILSGGLTPENIAQAAAQARPAALDVSSGVEAAKGIKDPARIAALFAALRGADAQPAPQGGAAGRNRAAG